MARRIVLVLTVALVLVAPGRWAIGAPAAQPPASPVGKATPVAGEGVPLDLAWLALAPADVPGGGYGFWTGSHQTLEGYARGLFTREETQRSFAEAAAAAGWRRAYDGWLALPSEEDPDNRARFVRTTLAQYATPGGALSGYRLLAEELARMGYERAGTAPGVGRESGVHRYAGTDQRTGARFQEVRLLARFGSVAAAISILDYENAAPTTAEVVALAKTVVARIERAAVGEAPGMSLQVPRLGAEGVVPKEDVYRRRNGEEVPSYRQDPAWLRSTDERNDRDRITDRYAYAAEWRPPAAPGAEPVTYAAVVHRFDDEAAAESYAATAPRAYVDNRLPPTRRAELVAGATGTMSGVAAFASDRETGIASGYIGWVRVGDRVASVALSAVPEVPRAAHDDLMRAMADCLASGSCLDPIPLPGAVEAVPGAGATPGATAGGTPGATPVATPVASPQGSLAATGACAVGAAPVATEAQASMDLAWAMPNPDAFGPEAGLSRSRFPTLRDYAGTFPSTGPSQPMLLWALENAGWRAAAVQTIAVPSVEDPDMFARSLEIGVAEFASADCASWALTAMADTLVAANHQRARSAPAVGEEAVALRRGATSSSGRPYEVLRLLVRSGAAVVDVAVLDWTDNAPPLSEAAALAETITERIPQARGAEAPRLGLRVPRLGAPGTVSNTDWYWRRNGEQLRFYNRDSAALGADDDFNDGLGVTDGYAYYADWTDPNRPSAEPVGYQVSVLRFASDAAATTWLEQAPERFVASPGLLFVEPIDDVGAVGDGSAVVEYAFERRSGGTVRGYRGWVRVGNLVATMALSAAPDVPRGAFAEVLRRTADCLSAACPERIALPAGLAGRPAAGATASGIPGDGQAPDRATVTIEAVDIAWRYDGERSAPRKPITVPVAAGATIGLPNLGASPHNFTVDALGISLDIPVGGRAQATIPPGTPPGDYEFYCNLPGHETAGMAGILRVQAGTATPVPDAPATPGTPTAPATGTPATQAAPPAPTPAAAPEATPAGTPAATPEATPAGTPVATNIPPRTGAGLA